MLIVLALCNLSLAFVILRSGAFHFVSWDFDVCDSSVSVSNARRLQGVIVRHDFEVGWWVGIRDRVLMQNLEAGHSLRLNWQVLRLRVVDRRELDSKRYEKELEDGDV
jgi:hypothetical protein